MTVHKSISNITKSYSKIGSDPWASTEIVTHRGTVIAFAQTSSGRFYYTILNLNDPALKSPHDADAWLANPEELRFPVEFITAGAESVSLREVPVVMKNGANPLKNQYVRIEDRHPYLATTASLSEPGASFTVVSDGIYVSLFRQSRKGEDGLATILMDRFNFNGKTLTQKVESRYQRSRNKTVPKNAKDTLGFKDLNNNLFYEPTHRLDYLIPAVQKGNFAVVLVPTLIPDEQNWQFFTYDDQNKRLHCVSVPRGKDGLFDERAKTFYVSKNPEYADIFSVHPGEDPGGDPLVSWNEHGGKQSFSFALPGEQPTCNGLDATVYARQTYPTLSAGESVGYSPIVKPILGEQRLLLVISSKRDAHADTKSTFITLDFGVSRDGRLVNSNRETLFAGEPAATGDAEMDSLIANLPLISSGNEETSEKERTILEAAYNAQIKARDHVVEIFSDRDFNGKQKSFTYRFPSLEEMASGRIEDFAQVFSLVDDFNDQASSARVLSDDIVVEFYDSILNGVPNTLLFRVEGSEKIESFDGKAEKTNDKLSAVVIKPRVTAQLSQWIAAYKDFTDDTKKVTDDVHNLHSAKRAKEKELKEKFDADPILKQKWATRGAELEKLPGLRDQRDQKESGKRTLEDQKRNTEADYRNRFQNVLHQVYLFNDKDPGASATGNHIITHTFPAINDLLDASGNIKPFDRKVYSIPDLFGRGFNDEASAARVGSDVLIVEFYDDIDDGKPSDLLFKVEGAEYIHRFDDKVQKTNDRLSAVGITPRQTLKDLLDKYKSQRDQIATHQVEINALNKQITELELLEKSVNTLLGIQAAIADLDHRLEESLKHGINDIRLEMPVLKSYALQGSTLDGGITGFAWSEHPPRLFANADGKVSLLFRGKDDQFFAAYYDVFADAQSNQRTHWIGDRPGMALSLDNQVIQSPHDASKHSSSDQLTLEAWIKPALDRDAALLTHSDYVVELKREKDKALAVQYNVHEKAGVITDAIPLNEWSHLALVYNRSYGLKFSGSDYVNCGKEKTLDITRDLTIEVSLMIADEQFDEFYENIVSKQEHSHSKEAISYDLFIDGFDTLCWRYSASDGNGKIVEEPTHTTESSSTHIHLQPNIPTRVAVTRKYVVDQKKLDGELEKKRKDLSYVMDMSFAYYQLSSYQDGVLKHTSAPITTTPTGGDGEFLIGMANDHNYGFKGTISEVRVWNQALEKSALNRELDGSEAGLVSWWRIEENEGYTIADSKSNNHGTIVGATWVENPDKEASTLRAYINGTSTSAVAPTAKPALQSQSLMLGCRNGSDDVFSGEMEEIRIWSTARTEEQLQDNLFRHLDSEFEHLLSYYDCETDESRNLIDQSGHEANIPIKPSQLIYSTAPVSTDAPLLRSALAGINTPFTSKLQSTACAAEYGDMQSDSDGNVIGIHKRVYAFINEGQWQLLTGFKVGDLSLEWIGQAQFDPQVIGFIEGAPPVPSENLTENDDDGYNGASSVEMTQADSTMYAMGTSSEKTAHLAIDLMIGVGFESESSVGLGAETSVEKIEASAGFRTNIETSSSSSSETEVGFGENLVHASTMSLTGYWENSDDELKAIGKRFVPQNVGYSIVQSETVDIFALRLKKSGLMVSKTLRKNPDIPRDWNIIMFPINPRYTKQGTLDGKVGLEPDEDYPAAMQYSPDTSYFKPIEAYRLKRAIEQQSQVEREKYVQFDSSFVMFSRPDIPQVHKRDIVNTYVWTADGGLFSESTETIDTMTEVSAGSFSWDISAGAAGEGKFIAGKVGPVGSFEVLAGGGITTSVMKSASSETGFSVNVELDVERDIFARDDGGRVLTVDGRPQKTPGKVDAYRFMTFYLSPDNNHLQELKNKIVDPRWLASDDPNAAAMNSALNNSEARPWRIMHRVTFISRVLPQAEIVGARVDNKLTVNETMISSNYELIQRLEPHIIGKLHTYAQFASAIREAIRTYLPGFEDRADDIVNLMGAYYEMFPNEPEARLETMSGGTSEALQPDEDKPTAPPSKPTPPSNPASTTPDDQLIYLQGIGERYQEILHAEGIYTFDQVANLTVEALEQMIVKGSGRRPPQGNAASWIEQAKAAR